MRHHSRLDPKKRYLQIALNSTLEDARDIIRSLPKSDRIIIEAGTPFIKRYGEKGITQIRDWYEAHLMGISLFPQENQQIVQTEEMEKVIAFISQTLKK